MVSPILPVGSTTSMESGISSTAPARVSEIALSLAKDLIRSSNSGTCVNRILPA